ncbi:MAG: dTDP-4-dehydrorhamnose 3,5-epimerase [Limisphaerales bacterium]|jgi:dTDP-4-dehydrorhamnose 3,5-epimerase
MTIDPTELPEVLALTPAVFGDARGTFSETFNAKTFTDAIGYHVTFVQDNHSISAPWVLRGLHYQIKQPQGKLVRVVKGAILDVAVDIRRSSPRFGQWIARRLDAENRTQIWVPEGFAHGFVAFENGAEVIYKVTNYYAPEHERTIAWNDPQLNIRWPVGIEPFLSKKDALGTTLTGAEIFD